MISKQDPKMGVLEKGVVSRKQSEKVPADCDVCHSESAVNMQTVLAASPLQRNDDNAQSSQMADTFEKETKVQLSFSVDRLLSKERTASPLVSAAVRAKEKCADKCCENVYSCCSYFSCLVGSQHEIHQRQRMSLTQPYQSTSLQGEHLSKVYHDAAHASFQDYKAVVRPMPIRALGNSCEVPLCAPFPSLPTASLIRFHQQQKQTHASLTLSPLLAPLGGLKALQINQHASQHFRQPSPPRRLQAKAHALADIPTTGASLHIQQQQQQQHTTQLALTVSSGNSGNSSSNVSSGKRKRSWSRAVFSNLQRKGLEIQFQQQKYITKPDRRKLAARLNLTDAQVKVWFQNRRMKWRHTRENLKSGQEKQVPTPDSQELPPGSTSNQKALVKAQEQPEMEYSTDSSCSLELSENDDEDEIDVVQ